MTPFDICKHLLAGSASTAGLKQSHQTSYPTSEYAIAIRHDGLRNGSLESRRIRIGDISKQSSLAETRQFITALENSGALPAFAADWARTRVDLREQEFASDSVATKVSGELEWDSRFEDFYDTIRTNFEASKQEPAQKRSSMPKVSSYEIRNRTVEIGSFSDIADTVKLFQDHEKGLRVAEKRSIAKAVREAIQRIGQFSDDQVAEKMPARLNVYAGDTPKTSSPYLIRARSERIRNGYGTLPPSSREGVASLLEELADVLEESVKVSGDLDLEGAARKLADLDDICGLYDIPDAYETIFFPLGEKPVFKLSADDDDPYIYQFGQVMIRRSDVEKLPLVPLAELERYFSESTVDALRANPVQTFNGLSEGLKRIVAEFIEETIRTRKNHLTPYLT